MSRCEFRNPRYEMHGKAFRHDGSSQCWITSDMVKFLGYKMCPLHLPPHERLGDSWGGQEREIYKERANLVLELIRQWLDQSRQPDSTLKFVIAGTEIGALNLEGATFPGDLIFSDLVIHGDFHAKKTRFQGLAIFVNTRFKGTVNFDFSHFESTLVLVDTTFETDFHLKAREIQRLELGRTNFLHPSDITGCEINQLSYGGHSGERLLISDCSLGSESNEPAWSFFDQDCSKLAFLNQDLSRARFLGADVRDTRFESCRWLESSDSAPYNQVYDETLLEHDSSDPTWDQQQRKLESLYRQLKKNLEENHDYRQAGQFHYREMRVRERILRHATKKSLSDYVDLGFYASYRTFADYGESVLKLMHFVIFIFMGTTLGLASCQEVPAVLHGDRSVCSSWSCLGIFACLLWDYFKVAVFSLVPIPYTKAFLEGLELNSASQFLVIFEAILLAILVPLLVMSVRRKYRR